MKFINTLRFSLLTLVLVAQAASAAIYNIAGTAAADEGMGREAAVGDFNCDTYDDLAVRSYGSGEFNIIYGGTGSGAQLGTPGNFQFSGNTGFVAMATGDFDGNGCDDLAIGEPRDEVETIKNAGQVMVLYGLSSGLDHLNGEVWNQNTGGVTGSAEAHDHFGASLAAGDYNGDGYDDLAIGVTGENDGAGAVYVLHGQPLAGLSALVSKLFTQDSSGIQGSSESGDYFGSSLASGDFNHDGYADLAVGSPYEDGNELSLHYDVGVAHVLYGSSSSLSGTDSQQFNQGDGGMQESLEYNDRFGMSLAVGDFDNDSYDDLAIGVPGDARYDPPSPYSSGDLCGMVHILYGTAAGITAQRNHYMTGNDRLCNGGFGTVLAAADFNNDNRDDLAASGPRVHAAGNEDSGALKVFYGASSGLTSSNFEYLNQDSSGADGGLEPGDEFGSALAAGDFDNDGRADLVVGVPGEVYSGVLAGVVQVFYGYTTYGLFSSGGSVDDQIFVQ